MADNTDHRFPQTRWSLVVRAAETSESRHALGELCELYWKPIYSFIRRSGWPREDAQDLTQEFLNFLLQREQLEQARPEHGKLRSYLLAYLKHFLSDRRKFQKAQKRGGGATVLSLDAEGAESLYSGINHDSLSPDSLFEQTWILTLLETVLGELKTSYTARGSAELFEALKPSLQLHGEASQSYAEISERLGMRESAVKVSAFRLRNRYRDAIRDHLQDTLAEGESVDEELRHFFQIFSGVPVT